MRRRGLHCAKHSARRERRRVTRQTAQAGRVFCLLADNGYVVRICAHVFGSDVTSAESFYEATMSAKDSFTINHAVRPQHDRFATTQRQSRQSILISHSASEPQQVSDRGFVIVVLPKPRAA